MSTPKKSAKRGEKTEQQPRDLIADLPCVKEPEKPGGGRNFWTVRRTGDYGWDCILGQGLAERVLRTIEQGAHHELLRNIVADMVRGGTFGGVEVGFMGVVCFEIAKLNAMARRIRT
jgi:hypothetical protein